MPEYSFNDYVRILEPLYSKKDPAHGLGHIRRLYAKSVLFSKKLKADRRVLGLGAALHGVVDERRPEAEQLLLMASIPAGLLENGVTAALESKADAVPETDEGKILHDAHLCEGGDDFLAVKSLATASFRGYPLTESYAWVSENILKNSKRRCYTKKGKAEYARKLRRLKKIWDELGVILGRIK